MLLFYTSLIYLSKPCLHLTFKNGNINNLWIVWNDVRQWNLIHFSIGNVFSCFHFPCFTWHEFKVLGIPASGYQHFCKVLLFTDACFYLLLFKIFSYILDYVLNLLLLYFPFNISLSFLLASSYSHFWFLRFYSFHFVWHYHHWNKQLLCAFWEWGVLSIGLQSLPLFFLLCQKLFSGNKVVLCWAKVRW